MVLHYHLNNGSAEIDEQPSLERNYEKVMSLGMQLVAYLLLVRPHSSFYIYGLCHMIYSFRSG